MTKPSDRQKLCRRCGTEISQGRGFRYGKGYSTRCKRCRGRVDAQPNHYLSAILSVEKRMYPLEPLLLRLGFAEAVDALGILDVMAVSDMTVGVLASYLGEHLTRIKIWKTKGLTDVEADRVAVKHGYVPYSIWPEWLDASDLIDEGQRLDDADLAKLRDQRQHEATRRYMTLHADVLHERAVKFRNENRGKTRKWALEYRNRNLERCRERDRERMKERRANESPEEAEKRREANRVYKREARLAAKKRKEAAA